MNFASEIDSWIGKHSRGIIISDTCTVEASPGESLTDNLYDGGLTSLRPDSGSNIS